MTAGTDSATIRIVTLIRIDTVAEPFASPEAIRDAVEVLATADAMGLLEAIDEIDRLDLATLRRASAAMAAVGVGREAHAAFAAGDAVTAAEARELVAELRQALEESPVPEREWASLSGVFGPDLLADLLGVSVASVRRYAAGQRATPDDVAARLHYLALVTGDLAGAYNDAGVRRWFHRKRARLDGKSPAALLRKGWLPEHQGPSRVRMLARSLLAAPAT